MQLLYSGFESFDVTLRLRDPRLVGDVLYEAAQLARPRDGHLPELTARLAQAARELHAKPALSGSARLRILVGEEHDNCVLEGARSCSASDHCAEPPPGVTAKPAIVIPVSTAVRLRKVDVKLYYSELTGPVQQRDAAAASWAFREQGVDLIAIHRPRIHAKMLLWDDDDAVVTSLNWLSADTPVGNPRQEIGITLKSSRMAAFLRDEFERMRTFVTQMAQ